MFSVSANYNISLPTPQLCQETALTFLSENTIFGPIFRPKVTLNRDATLTRNTSCHLTRAHSQKVTAFASSEDEKDGRNEIIISGNLFTTKPLPLQKRVHGSCHHSSIPSRARERNLHLVITNPPSDPPSPAQEAEHSPGGALQRSAR